VRGTVRHITLLTQNCPDVNREACTTSVRG